MEDREAWVESCRKVIEEFPGFSDGWKPGSKTDNIYSGKVR